uniref:Semaphorin 6C n=1 Tax=Terrapene triunguis TaxID=2587831 RepID=A0A674IJF6_9SAUR
MPLPHPHNYSTNLPRPLHNHSVSIALPHTHIHGTHLMRPLHNHMCTPRPTPNSHRTDLPCLSHNHSVHTIQGDHTHPSDPSFPVLGKPMCPAMPGPPPLPQPPLIWIMANPPQDECYNYIKVLVPKNDRTLFACGTNSFNPMCRTYQISSLEQEGEELNGQARCPFDAKQTNVALFAGTRPRPRWVVGHRLSGATSLRMLCRDGGYDSKWLREPHFLHALEYGNYVYFFFREISMEYTTLGRVIFSRVGRVCKNDMGGSPRVLEKYWTSFLKARLNCSVPGDAFFYFDVLQAVTDVFQVNGRPAVFGVFTTQSNSITGSAVCAFYLDDIERAFAGKFKEQKNADSAWTPVPEEKVPKPRPGSCASVGQAAGYRTSNEFPDETLAFIKSYPLLDEAVPAATGRPWFTKTTSRYKLTQLAVDTAAGPHRNYTVLFLGSEDGKVLKVLTGTKENSSVETLLLEEISVYSPAQCNVKREDRRIVGLELDTAHQALYVAFSSCVRRVPLSRCDAYGSSCCPLAWRDTSQQSPEGPAGPGAPFTQCACWGGGEGRELCVCVCAQCTACVCVSGKVCI